MQDSFHDQNGESNFTAEESGAVTDTSVIHARGLNPQDADCNANEASVDAMYEAQYGQMRPSFYYDPYARRLRVRKIDRIRIELGLSPRERSLRMPRRELQRRVISDDLDFESQILDFPGFLREPAHLSPAAHEVCTPLAHLRSELQAHGGLTFLDGTNFQTVVQEEDDEDTESNHSFSDYFPPSDIEELTFLDGTTFRPSFSGPADHEVDEGLTFLDDIDFQAADRGPADHEAHGGLTFLDGTNFQTVMKDVGDTDTESNHSFSDCFPPSDSEELTSFDGADFQAA